MAHGKFDRPALKLHTEDILRLQHTGGQWKVQGRGPGVSLVWLQGEIRFHTQDRSQVELVDGDSHITVSNCQNIPGGNTWISEGQYVMVVGEVDVGDGAVRAVKMVDLSPNTIHRGTWDIEVAEAKALVKENLHFFT